MTKKINDEVSDAELLAEIANETVINNTSINETVPNDNIGSELTSFQENIITTGSDVSVLLMIILLILFVIQLIRKTVNYFKLQSKIQNIVNPLDDAKPMAAENLTPINPEYNHKSYAVYNTEFEERNLYLQKQKERAPASVLKELLLKRAIKCIEKARALQRDGVGIRKNWNMDLLPRDVWDDFNNAQRNIQTEVECVVKENQRLQFQWGLPHRSNIFSKAKEKHEQKLVIQNKVFHQQMQLKQQQQQLNRKSSAPNAKSFGNSLNTGFFNNKNKNNNSAPLTKQEKQELKRQKKAMRNSQTNIMQNNIENSHNSNTTNTQVRRRKKQKHRFSNK